MPAAVALLRKSRRENIILIALFPREPDLESEIGRS
jgi:hypothetical protein